jgi:hypothetical protein
MSVLPSDVLIYGSANMPEADGATVGGAPDFTKAVAMYDITPTGLLDYVSSSSSDTATKIEVSGRDSTGAIQTETKTFNGTTLVNGAQNFERLLAGVVTGGAIAGLTNPGGTTGVGDLAAISHTAVIASSTAQGGSAASGTTPALLHAKAGDGANILKGMIIRILSGTGAGQLRQCIDNSSYGTDQVAVNRAWGTVPDATSVYSIYQGILFPILPSPITAVTRLFATAAADVPSGSQRIFYEKVFVVNANTATALVAQSPNAGVGIEVLSESPSLPSGVLLDAGLDTALDASTSSVNRQTAPSGPTFTTQPANVFVPSPGNLPPGAAPNTAGAIGLWLRLTVPAGAATYKGAATIQVSGNTV